jgi:hypothetical protein
MPEEHGQALCSLHKERPVVLTAFGVVPECSVPSDTSYCLECLIYLGRIYSGKSNLEMQQVVEMQPSDWPTSSSSHLSKLVQCA